MGREDYSDFEHDTVLEHETELSPPSMYKVVLLNDDYTPMEFVVFVLQKFFDKPKDEATRIMLMVHHQGKGLCGVYPYDIAETKVLQVTEESKKHQHPLKCIMEKE